MFSSSLTRAGRPSQLDNVVTWAFPELVASSPCFGGSRSSARTRLLLPVLELVNESGRGGACCFKYSCWPVLSRLLVNQYSVRPEGTLSENQPAGPYNVQVSLNSTPADGLKPCLQAFLA